MSFSIKNIQTGVFETFSTRKVLEILGDSINDQLRIKDKVYKISSCIESGTSNGFAAIQWTKKSFVVSQSGQRAFEFPNEITDYESLFLSINGVLCEYGEQSDYYLNSTQIIWCGMYQLEQGDKIQLKYAQII